jgi:hypothetical protein
LPLARYDILLEPNPINERFNKFNFKCFLLEAEDADLKIDHSHSTQPRVFFDIKITLDDNRTNYTNITRTLNLSQSSYDVTVEFLDDMLFNFCAKCYLNQTDNVILERKLCLEDLIKTPPDIKSIIFFQERKFIRAVIKGG